MESSDPKLKSRAAREYINLGRSQMENHLRTERSKERKDRPIYQFRDFLRESIWKWAWYYLRSRFGLKHPYPVYMHPDTGIYNMSAGDSNEIRIAIAGDWATNTEDAFLIADQIAVQDPEYTVHIGDIYFVGAPHEVAANFTAKGSAWVRGSRGSFAILGNHEMYGRGISFFRDLLPTLGIRADNGQYQGQGAGYFCLESPQWRIIGIDTGYNAVGLPLIERLPGHSPDCRLPDSLTEWLKTTVKLGDPADRRGIVILSHHQYFSAFGEGGYLVPAEQLAEVIGKDRPVIWLWGHEHKFAVYDRAQLGNGVTAYGRCIGHGGMPVQIDSDFAAQPAALGYPFLLNADNRIQKTYKNVRFGYNGFALIRLNNEILTLEYRDQERTLLAEEWKINKDLSLVRTVIYQSDELGTSF